MSRDGGVCAVPGCTERPYKGPDWVNRRLCPVHLSRLEQYGAVDATPKKRGPNLTPEQRDEVVRRVRAFESPAAVGRAMGITKAAVLHIMNRRKKAAS